jgi:DUF1680 family protein
MAVDTANKRYSFLRLLPEPDGDISSLQDRMQLLRLYPADSVQVIDPDSPVANSERLDIYQIFQDIHDSSISTISCAFISDPLNELKSRLDKVQIIQDSYDNSKSIIRIISV